MKRLIALAAIVAAPAVAQLDTIKRQPDLHEQQRQEIQAGRYGTTYDQQVQRDAQRRESDRRIAPQQQRTPTLGTVGKNPIVF